MYYLSGIAHSHFMFIKWEVVYEEKIYIWHQKIAVSVPLREMYCFIGLKSSKKHSSSKVTYISFTKSSFLTQYPLPIDVQFRYRYLWFCVICIRDRRYLKNELVGTIYIYTCPLYSMIKYHLKKKLWIDLKNVGVNVITLWGHP